MANPQPDTSAPLGNFLQQLLQMFGAAEPPMQKIPKFDWGKIPHESLDGPAIAPQGGAAPGPDLPPGPSQGGGGVMMRSEPIVTMEAPPVSPPARPYSPTPYTAYQEWVGPINPPQPGYHYDWSKTPLHPDSDPWNSGTLWGQVQRRLGI